MMPITAFILRICNGSGTLYMILAHCRSLASLNSKLIQFAVGASCWLLPLGSAQCQVDLAAILDEWARFESEKLVTRSRATSTVHKAEPGQGSRDAAWGAVGKNCFWTASKLERPGPGITFVTGMNSRYAFTLRRESDDRPYAATNVVQLGIDSKVDAEWRRVHAERSKPRLYMGSLPVSAMVSSRSFTLERISGGMYEGKEVLELSFTFVGTKEDPDPLNRMSIQQGVMTLMNTSPYLPLKLELKTQTQREGNPEILDKSYTNRYRKNDQNVWRKIESISDTPARSTRIVTVIERETDGDPIPESECTLSAFGLPEPVFPKERKARLWVWWSVGGGVAVLALGVYLWHRREVSAA